MRRKTIALAALAVLALLVSGVSCRRAPTGPSVKLFVNGTEAGAAIVPESPVTLASTLPRAAADPASWKRLEAHAPDGRFLDVRTPATTYDKAEVRFYRAGTQPAIGIFRPVREGLPEEVAKIARQPAVSLVGVTEVRVHTVELEPVHVPTVSLEIAGRQPWTLVPDDLDSLPAPPEGSARGRPLAAVIALHIDRKVASVAIEARGGDSHTVTAATLADPAKQPLLKVNNKGQWVYKEYGPGNELVAEVRDVVRLRVDPVP
jgi:hypothetical protein